VWGKAVTQVGAGSWHSKCWLCLVGEGELGGFECGMAFVRSLCLKSHRMGMGQGIYFRNWRTPLGMQFREKLSKK
jgi:hypothetical protein